MVPSSTWELATKASYCDWDIIAKSLSTSNDALNSLIALLIFAIC